MDQVEYQQTHFYEALHDWLNNAEIEQVSRLREHVDLALSMKGDQLKAEEDELKRRKRALSAAKKQLGIKRKYKTRKDKGTKRKPKPSADQVTE